MAGGWWPAAGGWVRAVYRISPSSPYPLAPSTLAPSPCPTVPITCTRPPDPMLFLVAPLLVQSLAASPRTAPAAVQDSVRIHRSARSAQAEFEGQRRHRLPVTWRSTGGRCDVQVGRFCYWHDDDSPQGPEEPASIRPLREDLTNLLDDAALALPGDPWIAGQRVRYLLEASRPGEALRAAEECRAAVWWCTALAGLVFHAEQSYVEADSAFDAALLQMSPAQRCDWEDASDLLPPRAEHTYKRLSCDERRAWLAPVWRLADPMWTRPGNDRRTEHYARQVMSRLDHESRSAYQMTWGPDTHELVMRYGWPERWSREPTSAYDPSVIRVIGHEPHPAFDFIPTDSGIAAPALLMSTAWDYRARDARSRYAPPYARVVRTLDAQVVRFFRGDSALVVAAFDVPRDTALVPAAVRGAMAIDSGAPGSEPIHTPVEVDAGHGLARVMAPARPLFVSVELTDTSHRGLARARLALDASSRSDLGLLLYRTPRPGDASLDDVVGRALATLRVSRRERLGLYWEYEARGAAPDTVTYVLTVYPRSASWLTRLARTMRLAEAAAPVHLRFSEWRGSEERTARSLGVDLSHLPPGRYDVRVRVELGGVELGRATRTVDVTR